MTETTGQGRSADEELAAQWAASMEEQKAAESAAEPAGAGNGAKAVKAPMRELEPSAGARAEGDRNLELILDIPVTLSMEIGRVKLPIRNLLQLTQGSVVELERLAGEPLDVTVNGTLIAHGEVVVVNERYGIRFTDVVSPAERVRKLK